MPQGEELASQQKVAPALRKVQLPQGEVLTA